VVGAGTGVRVTDASWGLLVELDAPERANALRPETVEALLEAVQHAGDRVVVLGSTGPVFCAGGDLSLFERAGSAEDAARLLEEGTARFGALVLALVRAPCPTIAAVRGAAAGGGMSLALACDLRVAGESAVLVPAFLQAGAVPDGGASLLLARVLGPAVATDVLLSGRRVPARSALGELVFCEVVGDEDVVPHACDLARRLAAVPQAARAVKQLGGDFHDELARRLELERGLARALARSAGPPTRSPAAPA
jgi:enoyl-CoA hydratase/carnithine racemase